MNTSSVERLIEKLCAAHGTPGCEVDAVNTAGEIIEEMGGKYEITPLGSIIWNLNPPKEGKAHILLDAHLDEVGMTVINILEGGFIKVAACGGVDRRLLSAEEVTIHTESGEMFGVVASVPPHLQEGDNSKVGKIEEFLIDTGLSDEKAKEKISLGDRVTLKKKFRRLLKGQLSGNALDDRCGCASILRAAQLLSENTPDVGITVMLSSMEESGGEGALTGAFKVQPTHAIAVDVSFAKFKGAPDHITAELGSGPMIGISPILSREVSKQLCKCADAHDIKYTREVMGGKTSTNADDITSVGCGVKTALISIPQKNMHSPIEIISAEDAEMTAQLIDHFIRDNF